ncbi:MAG TPA: M14 family zinc carboxypeptidase, partial [Thermoguttaceae bacterium]|nr:M14 family zinc carboxypeptidase [Thermoguttaceae bacterium]
MKHPITCCRRLLPLIVIAGAILLFAAPFGRCLAAEPSDNSPIVAGYADYETLRLQLESIADSRYATLRSLGRTQGGRDVFLLSIGAKQADKVPAILVLGNVEPSHLLGSELAVRLARQLVDRAATDKSVRRLLGTTTVYIIPRPAPDASEAFFRRPYWERSGNERPTDDDRDGLVDEDGPDDLDGDGLITMMRIEDPSGPYMPHPDDPRILIEADPKQGEQGRYRLEIEGRDNDNDERQGEDPAGGVAFNRNFTFRYPFYGQAAGPHQVSEPETRAVADFAFAHPNIVAVLTFTPEDNLMQPWKPGSDDSLRIPTAVFSGDAEYLDWFAEQYAEIHEAEDPPESPQGEGSFS